MLSSDEVHAARERLGAVGVWVGSLLGSSSIEQERQAARRIEELGYGSIWTGEIVGGKEAFAHQSVLLAATERIVTGTGIANVWARQPGTMEGGGATLGAAYPGRFVLGIGISHGPIVELSGQTYANPMETMVAYLDGMDASVVFAPATEVPVPRVLAALGPKMLDLARDRADGAHPYLVPPAHTALARAALGPDKLLIPEQAVLLETDPVEARRIGREHLSGYLRLPNYVNNLRRLGYGDDLAEGGSDRLVDAIVAWGSEGDIARRIAEHADNGADHVLLQPLGDLPTAVGQLGRLAAVVLGGSSPR
ncbi:MAG TPA: LLM class F420-dependent oxidoreductase [Acidimicrobiales bacterium]|nr:LLM class F420-dependent oxidoreductase [Acidimicrobiales bacterium]